MAEPAVAALGAALGLSTLGMFIIFVFADKWAESSAAWRRRSLLLLVSYGVTGLAFAFTLTFVADISIAWSFGAFGVGGIVLVGLYLSLRRANVFEVTSERPRLSRRRVFFLALFLICGGAAARAVFLDFPDALWMPLVGAGLILLGLSVFSLPSSSESGRDR